MRAPRFALPGTWARVDLSSDASTRRSIRKAVERSIGRDDKHALIRAELRNNFYEAAGVARNNSALDFYVALELAPGVPLPAWLGVFLPDIERDEFEAMGLAELQSALGYGVSSAEGGEAAGTRVLETDHIHAVRQAFRRVTQALGDEPSLDLLQVDYWLAAVNPNRIGLLTFTTNFVEFEEQMLELFDAVISTVRWPANVAMPPSDTKKV